MKTRYFALLSLVLTSGLWCNSASALVARRTAVVAQGPYGGTVVAASRTAIVRPGYGFLAENETQKSRNLCESPAKSKAFVKVSH